MNKNSKELIQQVKSLHKQILSNSKQSLTRAIRLGGILHKHKQKVGHGNFERWTTEYLPFTPRTARNYIVLNKNKDKIIEQNITSLNEAYELFRSKLPYSVFKNNFYENEKSSTVYTPKKISQYLFDTLSSHVQANIILDPAIGRGSLTNPWKKAGATVIGVDIDPYSKKYCDTFIHSKFEDIEEWEHGKPDFIICNPPFNGNLKKMYPELFIRHIINFWGEKIKIVMVVPMGFRLNSTLRSERWKWLSQGKLAITSIISLPINIFEAKFHTEILCFNIRGLKPHYFLYA
jgi:type I restriction enzyme M protein